MANIKVSELTELTSPTASSADKFLLITDSSSGIPVSKKISLSTLDTFLDVTNSHANGAFNKANGAYLHANAAFDAVNTFSSGSATANAAFINAQSAFGHANAGFTQSNTYVWPAANAAFIQANAGITHAQSAFITANASFLAVNTIIDFAASAFNKANGAYDEANNANAYTAANLATTLWATSPPATIDIAIERLANAVIILRGYSPIP